MAKILKVSGKKFEVPESSVTIQKRPGGWMIAETISGRIRFRAEIREQKLYYSSPSENFHGDWLESSGGGAEADSGEQDLAAQFPGKVRKVLVSVGDRVAEDQQLVLVEAMKMEFAVKAPFEGKVTKVLVENGQQISPGDQFVELERLG